ncbi:MFS transporter [Rhodococcoides corynebacterioides]|uniref:MFS transporter n=1 Tax=Rhodococcoides corynebacterioides TaxID=53972 RepID=UPI001C9AE0DA|nr:MFS transporter [Rhodococcus corynebacterioides]MBY6361628.1 MFS transporter [Rhodococcus corynebacterioides]
MSTNAEVTREGRAVDPRRWWGLGVLCVSLLVVVMANTSLIVALPSMTRDLGLSSSGMQWVVDAYTVPCAALMLLCGAIGDRVGRRHALVGGLTLFGAGAIVGAVADTTAGVVAARLVMGVGAAVIMPATLALLVAIFPRHERARAISLWAATSGLAIAVGPLLSGALLEVTEWGSTFLVNVPIVVVAVAAAFWLLPVSRSTARSPIDWVGGALSVITVGSLVYAVIDGFHSGWAGSPTVLAIVAMAAAIAFVVWERRHPAPLLNIRCITDRTVGGATLAVLMLFLAAFGVIYFVAQHFQSVFGYGALETGLRLLPLAFAVMIGSVVSSPLATRVGLRVVIPAGMALAAIGAFVLTTVDAGSEYDHFLVALVAMGLGMGLADPPATDAIMGGFGESELGAAGGVTDTSIELGGSLGIAVIGSVLAAEYRNGMSDRVTAVADGVSGQPPEVTAAIAEATSMASESVGAGSAVATDVAATSPALADDLRVAVVDSFAAAVGTASTVAGAVLIVGCVAVALVIPARRRPPTSAPDPTETATAPVRSPSR